MGVSFGTIAKSIGSAINSIGTYSAQATARANAISKQAQSAQGAFNQNSANIANNVDAGRLASQYDYNSAMMSSANEYNSNAWQKAAEWNEMMWQKQADFNAEQAAIQRQWQEKMANTSYQRAMNDMKSAGLNPILAYSNGGANVPGGAAASVGGAQMSSAQANMASGGLLGASTASEGNYTGIAENMGTTLALLGAIFAGVSSAYEASEGLGDKAGEIIDTITDEMFDFSKGKGTFNYNTIKNNAKDSYNTTKENGGGSYLKGLWNDIKETWNYNQNGEKIGSYHYTKANKNSKDYMWKYNHAKG